MTKAVDHADELAVVRCAITMLTLSAPSFVPENQTIARPSPATMGWTWEAWLEANGGIM